MASFFADRHELTQHLHACWRKVHPDMSEASDAASGLLVAGKQFGKRLRRQADGNDRDLRCCAPDGKRCARSRANEYRHVLPHQVGNQLRHKLPSRIGETPLKNDRVPFDLTGLT